MRRKFLRRGAAMLMGILLACNTTLGVFPMMQSYGYTAKTGSVNATNLNVRSGPGTENNQVAKLSHGTAVMVINEVNGSDGKVWYQIQFSGTGGAAVTGYVLSSYIAFPVSYSSDSDFEAYLTAQGFPETYKNSLRGLHAKYPNWVFKAQKTGLDWNTVIQNESVVGRNLVEKNSISSWKSVETGAYDWDTSVWPGFDGSTWVAASSDIISYYMDPRNFLDETYVFQFLNQSYDGAVHNAAGLQSLIKGTFLESSVTSTVTGGTTETQNQQSGSTTPSVSTAAPGGTSSGSTSSSTSSGNSSSIGSTDTTVRLQGPTASITPKQVGLVTSSYGPGMNVSGGSSGSVSSGNMNTSNIPYADLIMQAGAKSGVNPYVLAAMIIQEQGSKGTSASISGASGYYNYYNIGAYQSGTSSAVSQGLSYAAQSGSYERPWNTPEKAIVGGAVYYGTNYVQAGQDTFYLKKFNVQGSNLYKHQYMTNIQAAASEAHLYAEAYTAELKQTALEFKIPVYSNMPETACAKPTLDGSPNNKLNGLGVDGFALTPTFNKDTTTYDLIVDQSVASVNVQASAISAAASVGGTGDVSLTTGNNQIIVNVKAENGTVRTYTINIIRQSNGPTYMTGVGGIGSGTGTQSGSTVTSGGPGAAVSSPSTGTGTSVSIGSNVTVISPAGN